MQKQVMPYVISLPSDRIEHLEERYRTLPKNVHEFVVEGKKTGAIRSAGHYLDEIVMSRLRPKGLLHRSNSDLDLSATRPCD